MTHVTQMLIVQHEDDDPIGLLGERFEELGVSLDVRRGQRGETIPEDLDPSRHQGLIVLGGSMGADDDAEHAWLTHTKSLLRWAVTTQEVAVLGICLGHQLLTSALGGRVGRNPAGRALGLSPVGLLPSGDDDPLLAGTSGALALQWNDDVALELPTAATVLARSPDGAPQAVRFGSRAWGVQFHPEVDAATFASWSEVPDDKAKAAYAAEPALRHTWRPLADRFTRLCGPSPDRRK